MPDLKSVAILIVGYRNARDLRDCLAALGRAAPAPEFDVFVCENGGANAYRQLVEALTEEGGPCRPDPPGEADFAPSRRLVAVEPLRLTARDARVLVAQAPGNLGYGGGLNAWLEHILDRPGWEGVWVLNPDTEPDPQALAALVERARSSGKGMIGSTIVRYDERDLVHQRGGLSFGRLDRGPTSIGFCDRVDAAPDVAAIESRLDSISGASLYATRSCVERIGLMDESYFLYFEDIDWGYKAKRACGLGYASLSLVAHKHGSTIGSSVRRRERSRLAVYLQYRNRVLFAWRHFTLGVPAVAAIALAQSAEYVLSAAPVQFAMALKGIWAGLRRETGPPPWLEDAEAAPDGSASASH